MNSNPNLSKAVSDIPEAMSIQFNQMVYDMKRAGHDVIVLSLGEAFFDLPLFDFRALDFNKGFHYSDSQGIPELRKKIASYYGGYLKSPVDERSEVLVTTGSKFAIYMSMLAVLNPGDEVLVHEPYWLSYPEQARLCGAVPKYIPYTCRPADFERYFTPRTRLLILNNPNNPAGWVYAEKELGHLYRLCRRHGVFLLLDEAYSDFVVDGSFASIARVVPDKKGVIIVNSISKNMGMSGWRIGYVISEPQLIQTMLKINQHVATCAPTLLLYYCAKYFDDILRVTMPQVKEVVRKRERVRTMIHELGLKCLAGGSTFYFFLDIGDYPGTSYDFALNLLREKMISVVPGSAYGQSTDRFIRVSVGTESEERIWEALLQIKALSQSKIRRPAASKAK